MGRRDDALTRQRSHRESTFAWELVVGSSLARVTSVEMESTTLRVRAVDPRWLKEIERARGLILPKLQQMLGEQAVTRISIVS